MVRYDISVGSAEPFGYSTSQCKFTQTFRKEPSWRREIQAKMYGCALQVRVRMVRGRPCKVG